MKEIFLRHFRYPADNRKRLPELSPWNPSMIRIEGPFWEKGGITIAIGLKIESDAVMDMSLRVAIAKCNTVDNFSRKLGRVKALGRLNSKRLSHSISSIWSTPNGKFDYKALSAFCYHLASDLCYMENPVDLMIEKIDDLYKLGKNSPK